MHSTSDSLPTVSLPANLISYCEQIAKSAIRLFPQPPQASLANFAYACGSPLNENAQYTPKSTPPQAATLFSRERIYVRSNSDEGAASVFGNQFRIPDDLPKMLVRVLKVSGVAAPKSMLWRLEDRRPSGSRFVYHNVYFYCRRHGTSRRRPGADR